MAESCAHVASEFVASNPFYHHVDRARMDRIWSLLRTAYRHIWRGLDCDAGCSARGISIIPKKHVVAIIVIAYAGDLFTSYASSGNSLPTHLYAYGLLAYSTNIIIAAALFTYYIATILLISPPGPGTNPVSMISMYAMVLLLGRALSWSEKTTRKRFEAAQNKNRLQELESRARIADAIHDAVTGDLSAAAFVAQRHVAGVSGSPSAAAGGPVSAADAADAEDWRQINEYILFALTNVHRVIDELNMDATVSPAMLTAKRWPICCEPP